MTRIIIIICLVFSVLLTKSQPWMLQNKGKGTNNKSSFYETRDAFNSYWEGRKMVKGKGWKAFKRWEYFMEPRVYPSGYLNGPNLWNEYVQLKSRQINNKDANWTHLGPNPVPTDINSGEKAGVGRVNFVAFHPTDANTIFIGAPSGGFWKTTNGGVSWTTSTDELASIGVSAIAVNSQDPNIIFIATGDRDASDTYSIGILKSTNGGITWNATGMTYAVQENRIVERILIHPTQPSIMLAATNHGIFKSTNSGDAWTLITEDRFNDIQFKPGDPSVVYATAANWGNAKIYKSTNTGGSFSQLSSTPDFSSVERIELALTPANPNIIYALGSLSSNSGLHGVYKSTNSGDTWTTVTNGSSINLLGWETNGSDDGGQGWYDLSIAVSPTNENLVFVGGVNVWKSVNGGSSWNLDAHWYGGGGVAYVHADQHFFGFHPVSGDLFVGNDGGFYKKSIANGQWTDLSSGIKILQSYRLGVSNTDATMVVTGNQDNGTYRVKNGTWNSIFGGDGMECLVAHNNANVVFAEYYYGNMYKSTDGGYNFFEAGPSAAGTGAWVTPYIMHPSNANTMYAGFAKVFKSTNQGDTWTAVSGNLGGSTLKSLAISTSNPNYIYAATYTSIFKNTDGGAVITNWVNITNGLPNLSITYIAVSDNDPLKIWVTLSGYEAGQKVYYSSNGGQSWTNYSNGLPNVPANCIVYQNNSARQLYVGTDIGVYRRDSTMNEWVPFSTGLPNVIVNEMEIHYPSGKLRAATYGRGLWETYLHAEENTQPIAGFSSNYLNICPGTNITFTDASYASINSYSWEFGEGANPASATGIGPHLVSYSSTGSKTVKLIVEGTGGIDTLIKENYILVANQLPLTLSQTDVSICSGNSASITVSGADSYTWSPASGLNTTAGEVVIASPQQTTTYTVTGNIGSCSGQAQVNVEVTVLENDLLCQPIALSLGTSAIFDNSCASPQENEPVPPLTGCNGQMSWCNEGGVQNSLWFGFEGPNSGSASVEINGFDAQVAVYSANSCNDLLAGNYVLLGANDDMTVSNANAKINRLKCLVPGKTYFIQVDGSNGGSSGAFVVKINELSATLPPIAGYTYIANQGTISFNDTSRYASSYLWDFGDGTTSTVASPSHFYENTGNYLVKQKVFSDCGMDSVSKNINVTGIDYGLMGSKMGVAVFPNPSSGIFEIEANAIKPGEIGVKLFNTSGELVFFELKFTKSGLEKQVLNLEFLPDGFYYLELVNQGNTFYKKLIIAKK